MDDKERCRRIACLLDIVRDLSGDITEDRPVRILNDYIDDNCLTECIIELEEFTKGE